jgi:hypothetical protein
MDPEEQGSNKSHRKIPAKQIDHIKYQSGIQDMQKKVRHVKDHGTKSENRAFRRVGKGHKRHVHPQFVSSEHRYNIRSGEGSCHGIVRKHFRVVPVREIGFKHWGHGKISDA